MLQIGIREPGSAITHFIAMMMAIFATSPLLVKAALNGNHTTILAMAVFMGSMVCLIVLGGKSGYTLLAAVWGIAAAGMLIKVLWINCPKWFSSVIYIAMGWVCLFVFRELLATLSQAAFLWLLAGGLIYTVGGVIYALKLPVFNAKHSQFGSHEVFHLFVMAGSICHFVFMYQYVA